MATTPRIRAERRSVDELSDRQIEELMAFGKREAGLIDDMEAAVRRGDRDGLWALGETLVRMQDEAAKVTEK